MVSRYAQLMSIVVEALVRSEGRLLEAEAAALISRSPRRFRGIFLEVYGETFRVVRVRVRMQAAGRRLRETSESVAAISQRLGYSRPAKFVISFKREFRITPSQYRKMKIL